MTDSKNPFEAMIAQMQEMTKSVNPALETFTPEGFEKLIPTMPKEWMEMAFGTGVNKDGLDAKTRLLITVAGLTMQGAQAETPFRLAVRHAAAAGATTQEISETIGMMAMFAGLPASTRAAKLAEEALKNRPEGETGE